MFQGQDCLSVVRCGAWCWCAVVRGAIWDELWCNVVHGVIMWCKVVHGVRYAVVRGVMG